MHWIKGHFLDMASLSIESNISWQIAAHEADVQGFS